MKNLTVVFIALLIALTSCAEEEAGIGYKTFYNQYSDSASTITFKVPGLFASMIIDKEDKELKDLVKKIDNISFFVASETSKHMIVDLNKNVPEELYKHVMEIRDGETEIIFFARDNGEMIEEILMTVHEPNELVIMCIYGDFTREDAKKIAKAINTEKALEMRN